MSTEHNGTTRVQALKAAFPHTIPVLTGYLFMGAAFGILLQSQGYSFLWALLMSVTVYAGSMQFVAVNLLVSPFAPLNTLLVTLMVQARHIFYGFSMLEKFRDYGKAKPYMMFTMTDETFSLLYSLKAPEGIDPKRFSMAIAFLDHLYWITGCVTGAIIGSFVTINAKGIDFVMTALFVSIYVEQLRDAGNRIPAIVGVAVTAVCLVVFGADSFLLPSMFIMVLTLTAIRRPVEARR